MILLQIIPKELPASKEGVLWVVVTVLILFIGVLVRYINKLHIRYEKRAMEHADKIMNIVEKSTEVNTQLTIAVSNNSEAQKQSASEISRGMDRLGNLINENTKTIIQNNNKRE